MSSTLSASRVDFAVPDENELSSKTRVPSVFCSTAEVSAIINQGNSALRAGIPVHLCGPAGIGKTALAVRMAAEFGRPMSLLTGHEGLSPQDLVGQQIGHSESVVIDKYVQSVRRKQTESRIHWRDAVLAKAMRDGHTLIYDEFTRASPQANVLLLSVLEEGILVTRSGAEGHSYIHAHPEFRVILTSNPSDYVAVNAAPDALLDRMVTIHLSGYGEETESQILCSTTGVEVEDARRIVRIVTDLRARCAEDLLPSMRTSILIGKLVRHAQVTGEFDECILESIVSSVIMGRAPGIDRRTIGDVVRNVLSTDRNFS